MAVASETLYAATAVRHVAATDVLGRLFTIDPKNASAKAVGTIRIKGLRSVGIAGMAVHPKSRVIYAVTAGLAADLPPSLVTISPQTAEAALIGHLGARVSDINFNSEGTLFAWILDGNQLGSVNLATGAVSSIGKPGAADSGGGLAIDAKGRLFVVANVKGGSLDTVDAETGARLAGPILTGTAPWNAVRSLTFSPDGELFAVNANTSAPAHTALVTIDTVTGSLKVVGELPLDTSALAFSPDASASGATSDSNLPRIAMIVVAIAAVIAAGVVLFRWFLDFLVPD
jgi:DNA-binding beta-propeller fold protein YncE